MPLTYGDGRPALAAMYGFEKEAKDERAKILAKLEAESPLRQQTNRFECKIPTKLRQKVPREERGDHDQPGSELTKDMPLPEAVNVMVQKRPFTADELRVRKKEQFHGVKQVQQAAHGARARYARYLPTRICLRARYAQPGTDIGYGGRLCMDWSHVHVHKRNQPKETEPWLKAGYDHPRVVKAERGGWMCRSKEGWPMHEGGGYLGAVKEWHGGEYGRDPGINNRVHVMPTRDFGYRPTFWGNVQAKPGRAAYGRGWELRVNDSIGREAFVRCVPPREGHAPTPPWLKPGNDYGPWNQPEYHGRRGPRTHQTSEVRVNPHPRPRPGLLLPVPRPQSH